MYLTIINRQDLMQTYSSPGYQDFGLLELGDNRELMFATFALGGDADYVAALSRVALIIDADTKETLDA